MVSAQTEEWKMRFGMEFESEAGCEETYGNKLSVKFHQYIIGFAFYGYMKCIWKKTERKRWWCDEANGDDIEWWYRDDTDDIECGSENIPICCQSKLPDRFHSFFNHCAL